MGGSKNYLKSGGFSIREYKQIGTTQNGIKIIKRTNSKKDNTPMYSNTSETVYAKINSNSSHIDQLAIYKGRQKIKDIDTEHIHINLDDGRIFNKMGIHVHEYKAGIRNQNARKPSKKERRLLMVARYGRIQ